MEEHKDLYLWYNNTVILENYIMHVVKIIFSIMITLPMLFFGRVLLRMFGKELKKNSDNNNRRTGI